MRSNNPVKDKAVKTPKSKTEISKLKAALCDVVTFPFPVNFLSVFPFFFNIGKKNRILLKEYIIFLFYAIKK